MLFVRTFLGVVFVACMVALAGLGYRLWEVQRQLSTRVQAVEQRVASVEADVAEILERHEPDGDAVRDGTSASGIGRP